MCQGELISAVAMSEPGAGSDLAGIKTAAVRDGDEYKITGQKTFISNGQLADIVVTACKTDIEAGAKGISLILLRRGDPGFDRGRNLEKVGWKAQDTSELFFDEVQIPAERLLGEENKGFSYLVEELAQERLIVAVRAAASSLFSSATRFSAARRVSSAVRAFASTRAFATGGRAHLRRRGRRGRVTGVGRRLREESRSYETILRHCEGAWQRRHFAGGLPAAGGGRTYLARVLRRRQGRL